MWCTSLVARVGPLHRVPRKDSMHLSKIAQSLLPTRFVDLWYARVFLVVALVFRCFLHTRWFSIKFASLDPFATLSFSSVSQSQEAGCADAVR